jgi:hypothetical protein
MWSVANVRRYNARMAIASPHCPTHPFTRPYFPRRHPPQLPACPLCHHLPGTVKGLLCFHSVLFSVLLRCPSMLRTFLFYYYGECCFQDRRPVFQNLNPKTSQLLRFDGAFSAGRSLSPRIASRYSPVGEGGPAVPRVNRISSSIFSAFATRASACFLVRLSRSSQALPRPHPDPTYP